MSQFYTTKIAQNGQIVVPKELRDRLRLQKGDVLVFVVSDTNKSPFLKIEIKKENFDLSSLLGKAISSSTEED